MQPYNIRDLGYPRTPTNAKMRVTMSDGSRWDVPVQAIADSRDENYADEKEDTIGFIRSGGLDDSEIHDWASNNMNWDEVQMYAVAVPRATVKVDYQEGWVNGEKKIVGKL